MANEDIKQIYEKEAGHPFVREHYTETKEPMPVYAKAAFILAAGVLALLVGTIVVQGLL